jgi:hypothetical protein
MAKKKKTGKTTVEKLKRNLLTSALILLVMYIGIHIISRTDGARGLVADKISNGTRLPVTLKKCGATPLLGLRLQGLDFPGARMPDVRIKIDWLAWLSKEKPLVKQLDIDGLELVFRQVPATGNWEPLVLHDLGSKFGAVVGLKPAIGSAYDELPKFPSFVINKKTLLNLDRARVNCYDAQNHELAYVTDADSQVKIVGFSDRKALQVQLECSHIKLASGPLLRDFELETVKIDGYDHTLVMKMSCSDREFEGFQTKTLWEDLFHHLSQLAEM